MMLPLRNQCFAMMRGMQCTIGRTLQSRDNNTLHTEPWAGERCRYHASSANLTQMARIPTCHLESRLPMLFRIWFLYVCKVGLIGFALLFLSFAAPDFLPFAATARLVGFAMLIPVCVAGAVLGIMLLLNPRLFRCPVCDDNATFFIRQRKPSLQCEKCGVVSCKSVELSFKLETEPMLDENA